MCGGFSLFEENHTVCVWWGAECFSGMTFYLEKIMPLGSQRKFSHLAPGGQGLQVNAGFCEIILSLSLAMMAWRRKRKEEEGNEEEEEEEEEGKLAPLSHTASFPLLGNRLLRGPEDAGDSELPSLGWLNLPTEVQMPSPLCQ